MYWTILKEVFKVEVGAEDRHKEKVLLTQAKKRKRMDRKLKNETENWRRTNRRLSEPMNDSFSDDLWMIYPWTCFCRSKHQGPLTSEDAVSGEIAGALAYLSLVKRWPSGHNVFPLYQCFLVLQNSGITHGRKWSSLFSSLKQLNLCSIKLNQV